MSRHAIYEPRGTETYNYTMHFEHGHPKKYSHTIANAEYISFVCFCLNAEAPVSFPVV